MKNTIKKTNFYFSSEDSEKTDISYNSSFDDRDEETKSFIMI